MSARMGIFAVLFLVACGEAVTPNQPAAGPKATAPSKKTAENAAASPENDYYYNPAGKRDPFQGFLQHTRGNAAEMPADAVPLQRWDVDKFALKGVIWNTTPPSALLVDPEGIGHVVRMGTYVGRNWGKVSSISEGGVVVTEEYQTMDGELVVNPVSVRFPQETKK